MVVLSVKVVFGAVKAVMEVSSSRSKSNSGYCSCRRSSSERSTSKSISSNY